MMDGMWDWLNGDPPRFDITGANQLANADIQKRNYERHMQKVENERRVNAARLVQRPGRIAWRRRRLRRK